MFKLSIIICLLSCGVIQAQTCESIRTSINQRQTAVHWAYQDYRNQFRNQHLEFFDSNRRNLTSSGKMDVLRSISSRRDMIEDQVKLMKNLLALYNTQRTLHPEVDVQVDQEVRNIHSRLDRELIPQHYVIPYNEFDTVSAIRELEIRLRGLRESASELFLQRSASHLNLSRWGNGLYQVNRIDGTRDIRSISESAFEVCDRRRLNEITTVTHHHNILPANMVEFCTEYSVLGDQVSEGVTFQRWYQVHHMETVNSSIDTRRGRNADAAISVMSQVPHNLDQNSLALRPPLASEDRRFNLLFRQNRLSDLIRSKSIYRVEHQRYPEVMKKMEIGQHLLPASCVSSVEAERNVIDGRFVYEQRSHPDYAGFTQHYLLDSPDSADQR